MNELCRLRSERTIRSLRRRAKKKDRKKALNLGFVESYRAECVYPGLLPKDTRLCPGDPSSPAAPQDDSTIQPAADEGIGPYAVVNGRRQRAFSAYRAIGGPIAKPAREWHGGKVGSGPTRTSWEKTLF